MLGQYLANIKLLITNDPKFECEFLPISFFWESCKDNIITFRDKYKIVSDYVFTPNHTEESTDSTTGYPTYTGVQGIASCDDTDNYTYSHKLIFGSGGIDIACLDPVCRGGGISISTASPTKSPTLFY